MVRRPYARPRHAVALSRTTSPCSVIHPGPQRLGCCNGGCISPASRPDASSALGHGKCSAHNQQRPLIPALQRPRVHLPYVDLHDRGNKPERVRDTGDTGALATVDNAPLPPDILMGPASPTLSFAPTAQHTYGRTVWRLCQRRCCWPCTSSLCRHHTSPSHCPASAMRPLTSSPLQFSRLFFQDHDGMFSLLRFGRLRYVIYSYTE